MSFLLDCNPVFIKFYDQFVCFRTCIWIFFVNMAKFCINSPIFMEFLPKQGSFLPKSCFFGTFLRIMAATALLKLAIWSKIYSKDSPCSAENDNGARFAKQQQKHHLLGQDISQKMTSFENFELEVNLFFTKKLTFNRSIFLLFE